MFFSLGTLPLGLRPSNTLGRRLPLVPLFVLFLLLGPAATGVRAATASVPAGGDLQAALNAAAPGDTIILEAGATYVGPFTLPVKQGEGWVTIQSSAASQLPAGVRVTPGQAALMPKLVSPGRNEPALRTAPGAHHFRLVGIEFKPVNSSAYVWALVELGDGTAAQNNLAQVPHHLVLDRCYVHGDPGGELTRAIALNSGATEILNSHVSEAKGAGRDTQAICGWNGPGPYRIANNYLEGAGENVMFGGADPAIPGLVPSDIEIRGNTFSKPLSWRGVWTVKNLFELKNARRVRVEGNLFEHNWADGQAGYAILFTVRNQTGTAPWSTIEDVEFVNNVVRHSGGGLNVLGRDDLQPSQQTQRLTIRNNLFEDLSRAGWGGNGNFLIINGAKDVTVEHNTVLHAGNVMTAAVAPTAGFVFRNNLMAHNDYGIFGDAVGYGTPAISQYFPGGVFERNLIAGAPDWRYPAGNFYPASLDEARFVNRAARNYRLASDSPYRNAGTDGKDLGCDFDALAAALGGGAAPAPAPSPTPTPGAGPAPTPTPATGGARHSLTRARRDAQELSNSLVTSSLSLTADASSTGSPTESASRMADVVAAIQQTFTDFSVERAQFGAASRIETALSRALEHAAHAANLSAARQLTEAAASLRRAIDYLELADLLMSQGNVGNPVDYTQFFIRQHYVDFLGREPEEAGRGFWTNIINECGADQGCIEVKRIDVSANYFFSIEFRETGYLVYRLYRGTLGRTVLFNEFLAGSQELGRGVTVGAPGWDQKLAANKSDFFRAWTQRPDFRSRFDSLTADQFVDSLFATMGVAPSYEERQARIAELRGGAPRHEVLARIIQGEQFAAREFNRAFVLMQYFGYLRRDPDEGGYNFWLQKLEGFGGDYRRAEMVKAFLLSLEYRERFARL
jgi:hypothetical protein